MHERLIVRNGPRGVGEQVMLCGNGPLDLGKVPGKQILLASRLVSRSHCRLERLATGWWVQDQYSTNGLYVNALRVFSRELKDGDILGIGDYEFVYRSHPPIAPSPDWAAKIIRNGVPLHLSDEEQAAYPSATVAGLEIGRDEPSSTHDEGQNGLNNPQRSPVPTFPKQKPRPGTPIRRPPQPPPLG